MNNNFPLTVIGNNACWYKNKNFPLVKIRRYLVDFNLLFHRISSLSAEDIKRDSKKVAANAVVN